MQLEQFCSASRVLVVAGKGGVGKTTVAATLAVTAMRAGMSVLIVEVEGKSGLTALFADGGPGAEVPTLDYEERELVPGIRARALAPDQALVEYLDDHGMRRISKRLTSTGALEIVAASVPGMKDILVLGKIKQLEVARVADLIVVDAPAAGHAITFLTSASGFLDAVPTGPVRKQAEDVSELLADPARCRVVLVTLPEETPVTEVAETAFALEDRVGVALGPIVVNGLSPQLPAGIAATAADAGLGLGPDDVRALADAAAFLHERRRLQDAQVERLGRLLPLHQVALPFRFGARLGRTDLDVLADALADGIRALPEAALTP
jgi:anion-transporting  ArsA/GET3 family ATPase